MKPSLSSPGRVLRCDPTAVLAERERFRAALERIANDCHDPAARTVALDALGYLQD